MRNFYHSEKSLSEVLVFFFFLFTGSSVTVMSSIDAFDVDAPLLMYFPIPVPYVFLFTGCDAFELSGCAIPAFISS